MTGEATGSATEADAAKPLCVVCKTSINAGARKCLTCGSWQGWLRFLDVGNTSLSLFIAAISVLALSADNIARLLNWYADKELADFTVQLTQANPDAITLMIDNDGPGSVAFRGMVSCDVFQTATVRELITLESNNFSIRYPKPQEIVARTTFFYGKNTEIISPGTFKTD